MTLLQYLEQFIASRYPHIYDFYEEIVLNMDRGGKTTFNLILGIFMYVFMSFICPQTANQL